MEFNYREELKNSLLERRSKNTSYSLRAYARDLGVSSTALSDVLAGKRNFSDKNAQRIAERLSFSPEQSRQMFQEIKNNKVNSLERVEILRIAEDEFNLISNWYYIAILTLSQQEHIYANAEDIGDRLGVSSGEASEAIRTLERLGLISVKENKLVRTSLSLRTTTDVPSYAIRNYHKENLDVAKFHLDNTEISLREISSMNLNIDPQKINIAKKMINDFKEKFTQEMEKTSPKEVYTLAMHFFPANMKRKNND